MPSPEQKQNFALVRDRILEQNGKEYWRSLEEYADTPEFAEFISREYPHEIEEWDNSLSRRNFVKVMGKAGFGFECRQCGGTGHNSALLICSRMIGAWLQRSSTEQPSLAN
jgi:MoCo/4Fe-4S cofactor protein with predicted Tat translocation signal